MKNSHDCFFFIPALKSDSTGLSTGIDRLTFIEPPLRLPLTRGKVS
jgi:hypothetical protein